MTRKDQIKLAAQLLSMGWLVQPPAGFAESSEAAPTPAPKGKGKSLAERVGDSPPDVETVEIGGTTYTRRVGSVGAGAPHGLGVDGKPLAPFGYLSDGSRPRKSAAGRPPSEDAPPAKAEAAPQSSGFSLDFGDIDLDLGDATPKAKPAPTPKAKPAPQAEPEAEDLLADLFAGMS